MNNLKGLNYTYQNSYTSSIGIFFLFYKDIKIYDKLKQLPSLLLFRNVNYVELLHVPRHPDHNVPRDLNALEPVDREVRQNLLPELLVSKIIRGEIELVLLVWEQNALTNPELVAQKLVHVLNLIKCGLLLVQLTNR